MSKNNRNQPPQEIHIESLSHEGRGIAHINNKTVFIENALPDENIKFVYTQKRGKFDTGIATDILTPSPNRVIPECKHTDICGGCNLQHINPNEQVLFKTKTILEQLKHIGGIVTKNLLPSITGPSLGYRNKARLSVKYVQKKQKILIGFHEKNGRYIAEINSCKVLNPKIGEKIDLLSELVTNLSIYQYIPQIEVACGDNIATLVFRNLQPLTSNDIELINNFAKQHNLQIYSQSGGIGSIRPISQNHQALSYKLLNNTIEIIFEPTDFTQINPTVNKQLVEHIINLLEPNSFDTILDLFCGIGNFTLPIATKCNEIIGVEGNNSAVLRAKQNAELNNICNAKFYAANLTKELSKNEWSIKKYNKIILDPPRTGALEICEQIKKFNSKQIVYVSCNSATFARDAKILVENGYNIHDITIADMYPHTKHIEVIASFRLVER